MTRELGGNPAELSGNPETATADRFLIAETEQMRMHTKRTFASMTAGVLNFFGKVAVPVGMVFGSFTGLASLPFYLVGMGLSMGLPLAANMISPKKA